jgi:replication-associated recombination protein RarA
MLLNSTSPLAERMRPARLEDLIGQEHLVGSNGIISKAIETGNVPIYDFVGATRGGENNHCQYYCQ